MRNMSKCVTALNLQGKNMFHNTYTINKSICFHSFDSIIFFYTVSAEFSSQTNIDREKWKKYALHSSSTKKWHHNSLLFGIQRYLALNANKWNHSIRMYNLEVQLPEESKKRNDVEVGARCVLLIKCIASKEEKKRTQNTSQIHLALEYFGIITGKKPQPLQ